MKTFIASPISIYRIAGNFGGSNFRYFRDYPASHEIFHPRNFPPTNFQSVIAYPASGVTKFKTTKINSEDQRHLFTKICTPENYPLYGSTYFIGPRFKGC